MRSPHASNTQGVRESSLSRRCVSHRPSTTPPTSSPTNLASLARASRFPKSSFLEPSFVLALAGIRQFAVQIRAVQKEDLVSHRPSTTQPISSPTNPASLGRASRYPFPDPSFVLTLDGIRRFALQIRAVQKEDLLLFGTPRKITDASREAGSRGKVPLTSEFGTCKAVTAGFWPWL